MKGLLRYLSPFAPDLSGAVSILFELGGVIVICDAGGCTGNVCGFDEPRWFEKKSAIFSAGLRDVDAILGRDDRLFKKIEQAVDITDPNFIALIGTPVPAVIASDYESVCRKLAERFQIPAFYIPTYGMRTYEEGEIEAYKQVLTMLERGKARVRRGEMESPEAQLVLRLQEESDGASPPQVGIWGASPLDFPALDSAACLRARARERGARSVCSFGMDASLADWLHADEVERNLVCSPAGLIPARALERKYQIPYEATLLLADAGEGESEKRDSAVNDKEGENLSCGCKAVGECRQERVLIVHQQIFAGDLRERLRARFGERFSIDVASFFRMDEDFLEEGDAYLASEREAVDKAREGYQIILADPLFLRALRDWEGKKIELPQFAISGAFFAWEHEMGRLEEIEKEIVCQK